jgi:sterol desaturase/sphingolipid hydroxylase (fatty acid hydroxylase superfamily)
LEAVATVLSVWGILQSILPTLKTHFGIVLAFALVEQLLPAERKQPIKNHLTNAAHVLIFFIMNPFIMVFPSALVAAVARKAGPGLININVANFASGMGAMEWPLRNLLLPFAPLLIADFFYYWHHRFQHRIPALWATHRLHHGTESLSALASYRIHWLEEPIRIFTMVIPTALLFNITPVQGAWIAFGLAQMGILIHANVRIPYGPMTRVLTGPQLHRLHHSSASQHRDKNYSAVFPIWDMLFGTYVAPKKDEWPATGLGEGVRQGSILEENAYPFLALGRTVRGWLGRARPEQVTE